MTACSVFVTIFVGLAVPGAASGGTDMQIELDVNHLDRLTRANMRVAAKKALVDRDPLRPIYHIMPLGKACVCHFPHLCRLSGDLRIVGVAKLALSVA